MRTLYNRVSELLDRIDFSAIYTGFTRFPFALYDKNTVWLSQEVGEIPRDERFMGNTAIKFNGGYMAVWDMSDTDNISDEVLAALLVHEMFHAYQYACGEKRFPNDLRTLMYPNDTLNFTIKYAENNVLAQAARESDTVKKNEMLARFFALREERRTIIGNDMLNCELYTETAEGMAEYAGLCALKVLDGGTYVERVTQYTIYLITLTRLLFNIRRICYYSGALLLLTANDIGININDDIGGSTTSVYDVIKKRFVDAPRVTVGKANPNKDVSELMSEYVRSNHEEIQSFHAKHEKMPWHEGDFSIVGYDPMNMLRENDLLFCKTFVALEEKGVDTPLTFVGKTLLKMRKDSEREVLAYLTVIE